MNIKISQNYQKFGMIQKDLLTLKVEITGDESERQLVHEKIINCLKLCEHSINEESKCLTN